MSFDSKDHTKFTVVIPTRDRCDTLIHCLNSVLSQDYDNIEIIVSDNASVDSTESIVRNISDTRVRYINTGQRVSMSHNWEFALNHINDGWVTVLGDDDALIPGALRRVDQIINESGTQAIRSNGASYIWPSLLSGKYGRLSYSLFNNYVKRDSKKSLLKVLRGEMPYNELPMLYNGGFIDSFLIKKAKLISGNFFHSMTPDVYSAMVFSLLTENYIYSNEALAINGASHHSGGTSAFEIIKRKRNYDPEKKFLSEANIALHEDIPLTDEGVPVKSLHVCVLEAFLQSQKYFKLEGSLPSYQNHLDIVLRESYSNSAQIISWVKKFTEKHSLEFDETRYNLYPKKFKSFSTSLTRIIRSIGSFSPHSSSKVPINNVYEASIIIGFMKETGISFVVYFNSLSRRIYEKIKRGNS